MTSALYQIVYVSRVYGRMDAEQLMLLRTTCFDNNQRNGITGLLVFDGHRFLQAIEGGESAINSLMRTITRDTRHDSVSILASKPVARREFGNFSMSFDQPSGSSAGREFRTRVMADVSKVSDPAVQAAFIGFARLTEHPDARPPTKQASVEQQRSVPRGVRTRS